jgi:hypothetical protein
VGSTAEIHDPGGDYNEYLHALAKAQGVVSNLKEVYEVLRDDGRWECMVEMLPAPAAGAVGF